MRRDPTFSGPRDAHCLFAVGSLASPDGNSEQNYSFELTKRRNRLVLTTLNLSDASEHAAVYIFDQMSLRNLTCGVVFHMDWAGNQRFSRTILTLNHAEIPPEELDRIWEADFGNRYLLSLGDVSNPS